MQLQQSLQRQSVGGLHGFQLNVSGKCRWQSRVPVLAVPDQPEKARLSSMWDSQPETGLTCEWRRTPSRTSDGSALPPPDAAAAESTSWARPFKGAHTLRTASRQSQAARQRGRCKRGRYAPRASHPHFRPEIALCAPRPLAMPSPAFVAKSLRGRCVRHETDENLALPSQPERCNPCCSRTVTCNQPEHGLCVRVAQNRQ